MRVLVFDLALCCETALGSKGFQRRSRRVGGREDGTSEDEDLYTVVPNDLAGLIAPKLWSVPDSASRM